MTFTWIAFLHYSQGFDRSISILFIVTDSAMIPLRRKDMTMPLEIIHGDITQIPADAIVNAANPQLQMGGGVCGAIFRAAGPKALQAACDKLAPIQTGQAVITPAFALPATYVIHTPGPVYSRQSPQESENLLVSCYRSCLTLAAEYGCRSIAFPLISSGIYGYPYQQALDTAIQTIQAFLKHHDMDVRLVLFD